MNKKNPFMLLALMLFIGAFSMSSVSSIAAESKANENKVDKNETLKRLCSELKATLKGSPELKISCDYQSSTIRFNSKTPKEYTVRIPNMMGELQKPRQVDGPSKGGFLGDLRLIEGDTRLYQAVYPQSFPFFYDRGKNLFTRWGWTPYSKKYGYHVKANFACPEGDISPRLAKFEKFLKNWQSYVVVR